ncbi:hypothetical protein [Streptomyces pseudovenezuelae]|uniref:Secreted protein n=1 Tax=Streptomyces pseudovenezuelae TaxID=67350 RepID=A0ABT6LMY9_9ACTN|nr:hypothetical protein [Streptomyces pseudovenezuelae]MDH6217673.1 hypothetical protein [Streptomyces pseudovenezuelae]
MLDRRRPLLGGLGALALALAAVFTAGPAQAAAPDRDLNQVRQGDQVLTMPAAPPSLRSAAAEPPTAWPKPDRIVHVPAAGSLNCTSGNLCVSVWDATKGDYVVFFLYYCDTYALSNFVGTGSYHNAQTGGAVAQFYGKTGNLITSVGPGGSGNNYNWSPVWSIRNC